MDTPEKEETIVKKSTTKQRVDDLEKWVEVFKQTIEEIAGVLGKEAERCKENEIRIGIVLDAFEKHAWTPDAHNPLMIGKRSQKAAKDKN